MNENEMDELKYAVLDELDEIANLIERDVCEITPNTTQTLRGHLTKAKKQLSELKSKLSTVYAGCEHG